MSLTDPLVIIALLVALMLAVPCSGAQYYLSPEGSDDAPGTAEQPWQTIDRANQALQVGDEAIFLPGDYPGTIAPERSGAPDAPIVYRSAEPLAATLTAAQGATPSRLAASAT